MALQLRWLGATTLPVAAEGLSLATLAPLSAAERLRWPVRAGKVTLPLGELFRVEGSGEDGHLVVEGDLRQLRGLGRGWASGTLTIRGTAGVGVGAEMSGGAIEVFGSAGDWAGAALRGGLLRIHGDAGNFVGAAWPGARVGMREGAILVDGKIGDDAGIAMRRGLIAVGGGAGNGLGRGMVAGSIFAFGAVGRLAGAGMKRGTLALFGLDDPSDPPLLPTFAPAVRYRPPFLTIYLRQLARWGFPVPESAFSGEIERYNGDLGVHGQGEILVAS